MSLIVAVATGTTPSFSWAGNLVVLPIAFMFILFLGGPLQEEYCSVELDAGMWGVFEVESVTRDELPEQRVLCPVCYDGAFTTSGDH